MKATSSVREERGKPGQASRFCVGSKKGKKVETSTKRTPSRKKSLTSRETENVAKMQDEASVL